MADDAKYALLGDVPVGEAEREDLLKFSPTAKVLADAAVQTRNPLTIGIFGEWGTGKTSLMRLIMKYVQQNKKRNKASVWFNAWQFEKEEHLIVPLVATINKELTSKGTVIAKEIAKDLLSIACGISLGALSLKDVIDGPKDTSDEAMLERSLYFDAYTELAKHAGKRNAPRIVVFVDDLDRCFPDKAVELLEHMKLVLHQRGFAFVLGVNDAIIEDFIKTKYQKDYNISPKHFEKYLDKIVQVKIPVPEREPQEMRGYITALLKEGRLFAKESSEDMVSLIADACGRNPRSIVRLLNRIIVTSLISEEEDEKNRYDPLALLLHIAMDEPRYISLRKVLDTPVRFGEDDTRKVGEYLAEQLGEHALSTHMQWAGDLRENVGGLKSGVLEGAVQVLEQNEYLCDLLKSEPGKKWLTDPEFRRGLGEVSVRTIGEKREETREDIESVIRDLQDNMVRIEAGKFNMGVQNTMMSSRFTR